MKNELIDLNDHLFAQLERLGDENITPETLEKEVSRSRAILSIAGGIVQVGQLAVDAQKVFADTSRTGEAPRHLRLENKTGITDRADK